MYTQNDLQKLFALSPMPVFAVDTDFSVIWANGCAEKRYPQLLVAGGLSRLISSKQIEAARAVEGGFSVPLGVMPDFAAYFTPIEGGYLVTIGYNDSESAFKQLPQNINFMTGMISGQLRMPVSNLFGIISSIARVSDNIGDRRLEELAKAANGECYRLLRFAVDINSYLKSVSGSHNREMFAIDLNSMLSELCDVAKMILPVPLKVSLSDSPVIIKADEQSLCHALLHIISNSCRYGREENVISVSLRESEKNAVITISDRGRGIPAEALSKVCEPFFSRDPDGMPFSGGGLGLSIVSAAVSRHGGTMAISSAEEEGTSVAVSLPLCEDIEFKFKETADARDMIRDHKSLPYIILSDCCECPDP